LLEFHESHGCTATLTAVKPQGRFGVLDLEGDTTVRSFREKIEGHTSWINGGFFVLEPAVFDLIDDDSTIFERKPLEALASSGHLMAYKHDGFWYAMDKLSDKIHLENLWASGIPPWRLWGDKTHDLHKFSEKVSDFHNKSGLQSVEKMSRQSLQSMVTQS